jgi:hypothetical protein
VKRHVWTGARVGSGRASGTGLSGVARSGFAVVRRERAGGDLGEKID